MTRTRTAVTLVVLAVMFVAAVVVGVRLALEPAPALVLGDTTEGCQVEIFEPGDRLQRSDLTVDVYNASSTQDLANKVMGDLGQNRVNRGEVGNTSDIAERGREIKTANVKILTSDPSLATVQLLRDQFRGKVRIGEAVEGTDDADGIVRVVVGPSYQGVDGKAPAGITVRTDTPSCVPPEDDLQLS